MDEESQDDQLEPIYNSSVPVRKTSRERWSIEKGGGRGSEISVLIARHDDDDDEDDDEISCFRGNVVHSTDNCAGSF